MKTINFVLPFPPKEPTGGPKVMYIYANMLVERGYKVNIYHSLNTSYKRYSKPYFIRRILHYMRRTHQPNWFELDARIHSINIKEVNDSYIKDGDVIISTWWATALEVSKLSKSKGKKINLIQDYENWKGYENLLHTSYDLPNTLNVVIATYLIEILKKYTQKPVYVIPNSIDTTIYKLENNIEDRKPSILMLYSKQERKGSLYAIEVVKKLYDKYGNTLKFSFFGTHHRPSGLPSWVNYVQKPDHLTQLYNEHSIFLTTSIMEGWGLPACEAMACGCCVIASEIDGHKDFIEHNESGIFFESKNVNEAFEKIMNLIDNDEIRIRIAKKGNHTILNKFSLESSVQKLIKLFFS
ncbi:putative glycosyltransferase [Flavobacteriaceae bacterium UJ101]|nr:putative glycosyltransferase [Flavobacteriaceae bacterium UJ101]